MLGIFSMVMQLFIHSDHVDAEKFLHLEKNVIIFKYISTLLILPKFQNFQAKELRFFFPPIQNM